MLHGKSPLRTHISRSLHYVHAGLFNSFHWIKSTHVHDMSKTKFSCAFQALIWQQNKYFQMNGLVCSLKIYHHQSYENSRVSNEQQIHNNWIAIWEASALSSWEFPFELLMENTLKVINFVLVLLCFLLLPFLSVWKHISLLMKLETAEKWKKNFSS